MDITLSLEKGRRLCKVKGGKYNGKTIYLLDKRKKCCNGCDKKCRGNCCDDCEVLKGGCCDIRGGGNNDVIKYLDLQDSGMFSHMPTNENKNSDHNFINGKRGAGKTYYLSKLVENYVKLFPKNPVFLFSLKPKDDLLDNIITKRVDLNSYVEEGGLTASDFPDNSFIIYDDIDMINSEGPDFLQKKIYHLMNSLIQLSRDRNITVAQTSHLCTNNQETKHSLNGASCFVFFYGAVSPQIKNALKTYLGLSKENIKLILGLKNSRSCTIFTTVPPVVMTEKEILILDN